MIPGPFEYHRPGSVDEVVALLGKFGDDGRVIAGGHSLIPMMKLRLAVPEHLIDLRDVGGLDGISEDGDTIVIGALTTQAEVLASDLLASKCPIIPEAARVIADPQVRYVGTMGGNVANGDPGNDMPALMQCLDASYVLQGPNGERTVAARDFYEAAYFTKRMDDELLTAIRVPTPADGHGSAYEKLKRKTGDYATAAAAVILGISGGTCTAAAIALTNVADTPLYAEAAGQALVGTTLDDAAIDAAVEAAKAITAPASDLRGPAEYRTYVAGVMVRRAIERAQARTTG
ncbi:MAG: xanthine dehydrogenase family protein subunit M [Alphaproteobacteria bacterium]